MISRCRHASWKRNYDSWQRYSQDIAISYFYTRVGYLVLPRFSYASQTIGTSVVPCKYELTNTVFKLQQNPPKKFLVQTDESGAQSQQSAVRRIGT